MVHCSFCIHSAACERKIICNFVVVKGNDMLFCTFA